MVQMLVVGDLSLIRRLRRIVPGAVYAPGHNRMVRCPKGTHGLIVEALCLSEKVFMSQGVILKRAAGVGVHKREARYRPACGGWDWVWNWFWTLKILKS